MLGAHILLLGGPACRLLWPLPSPSPFSNLWASRGLQAPRASTTPLVSSRRLANLANANAPKASFNGADLTTADLRGASFDGASLKGARLPPGPLLPPGPYLPPGLLSRPRWPRASTTP